MIDIPANKPYFAVQFGEEGISIAEYCLSDSHKWITQDRRLYSPIGNEDRKWLDTQQAADIARQARFEFGEAPTIPKKNKGKSELNSPRMITICLRASGNRVRDNLRMKLIFGVLISYPGDDRFVFQAFENGEETLVGFPYFTTSVCPELLARLVAVVGQDNIHIEPIVFV